MTEKNQQSNQQAETVQKSETSSNNDSKNKNDSNNKIESRMQANTGQQRTSFKGIILLFTLIFCLVIYFVIKSKDSWLGIINRFDPINNNKVVQLPEPPYEKTLETLENDQLKKNDQLKEEEQKFEDETHSSNQPKEEPNKNNDASSNNLSGCSLDEDQLTKFAPNEDFNDDEDQDLNPYTPKEEKEAKKDNINDLIAAENFLNNLSDYRVYLANVSQLLANFSRYQSYTENLLIIKQLELPKEIENIVKMLEDYDKILSIGDSGYENVKLTNLKYIDKFLKIQKETIKHKETKQLKLEIEKNIDLFIEYMFSAELQGVFLR